MRVQLDIKVWIDNYFSPSHTKMLLHCLLAFSVEKSVVNITGLSFFPLVAPEILLLSFGDLIYSYNNLFLFSLFKSLIPESKDSYFPSILENFPVLLWLYSLLLELMSELCYTISVQTLLKSLSYSPSL